MNIPEFSVKRGVTATMLALIIVVVGVISYTRLGLDLMPDITYPVVFVTVSYPGASPEDVEELVTRPIEEQVVTVKNVKDVESSSQEGISVLFVGLEWGTNIGIATQDIRDRIDVIKDFLPEDIGKPMVFKFDPTMMPIMVFGVTSSAERDLVSLRRAVEDVVKERLERLAGVASAMVMGGLEREVLVEVDKKKLNAHGITLPEIIARLRAENYSLPGGHLRDGYKEYILRTSGEFKNIRDIDSLLISFRANAPIYLRDLATVRETTKDVSSIVKTNKRDSVVLLIYREAGANTVVVSEKVRKELKQIQQNLPADIELHTLVDISDFINRITSATVSNAITGGIFAIIVLYFFLWNWRPTFTIALSIPFSILATFIALYFWGQTLNFVTMIGIALGVGMLVDNSIVVIENIYRRFTEVGEDRIQASINGASEVGMAITASTLTTLIVFLPLIFATGVTAMLFEGLGIAVSSALLASLFISLTIVPLITSRFLSRETKSTTGKEKKVILPLRSIYRVGLEWALKNKFKTMSVVFSILTLCIIGAIFFAGREFFPEVDSNMVSVRISMPTGTVLEETERVTKIVEESLLKEKYVKTVLTQAGLGIRGEHEIIFGDVAGPCRSELFVRIYDSEYRKDRAQDIIDRVNRRLPNFENVTIEFLPMGKAMMMGGGMAEKPIDIKIFGTDLNILETTAEQVKNKIKNIDGITNVSLSLEKAKPELAIRINREKLNRLGLNSYHVAQTIQAAIKGKVATRAHWAGEEFDVRVQLSKKYRDTTEDIKKINLQVPPDVHPDRGNINVARSRMTSNAKLISLDEVADIKYETGPVKISRENQRRVISVNADVIGRNIGRVIDDIKKETGRMLLPDGYFIDLGGEAERIKETFRDVAFILLLAIILIYMVMAAVFESFVHPFVIMFTVPFSIIGVLLGLLISGKAISLPAGMGMLILSGVIVNNGVVLVDYINRLRAKGKEKYEAVIEACMTRLRPIMMTAITTILAMIPMLLSRGEGYEVRSTVAIVIISGLAIGTLLTLIVLPVVYTLIDDYSSRLAPKLRNFIRKD